MMKADAKTKRKVRRIQELLAAAYGEPSPQQEGAPLDSLIMTILSQNTNDVNSHRAYRAMREAFPTWEDVMRAPRAKLERVLKPGGLARTKSGRIQRILRSIADSGELSLDHLRRMADDEAERCLLAYEGVGYKTARCVLLFALGRDAFPIDTHILRVLKRLGILPEGMSADKAHEYMPPLIPKGKCYIFHVNLIAHGRQVCHPRKPECAGCVLRRLCAYGTTHEC